jgi:RP/EB family microtubule-associated protein
MDSMLLAASDKENGPTPAKALASRNSSSGSAVSGSVSKPAAATTTTTTAGDHSKKALSDEQVRDFRLHIEGLQKERDFYYEKLREIEEFLQEREEQRDNGPTGVSAAIFKILYATTDDFVAVDPGAETITT